MNAVRYEIPAFASVPVWEKVPAAAIADFPWDENGCRPVSGAKLCSVGRRELRVRMWSYEENPRVTHLEPDTDVYEDSCLELFVCPADGGGSAAGYFNFEMNAAGTLLGMIGPNKRERRLLRRIGLPPEHLPEVSPFGGGDGAGVYWGVELRVPGALFSDFFPAWQGLCSGAELRGNFYKCGDLSALPHYGCWSHIGCAEAEFHVPETFGSLVLL